MPQRTCPGARGRKLVAVRMYDSTFQFFRSNPNSPLHSRPDRSFCHSNPQRGRQVIKSDHPLNCICSCSSHTPSAQQAPLASHHFNNSTPPPQPNRTRNRVSLLPVLRSSPMRSKARATQTNGSPARACLQHPRTDRPTRSLMTMTLFTTSLQICSLPAQHSTRLLRMIGNRQRRPSPR